MAKTSPVFMMVALVAVVAVGFIIYTMTAGTGVSLPGSSDNPIVNTCDSTTSPTVTVKAYDKDSPGTALTEATNLYRVKGEKTWNEFATGTGFEASVNDVLEIALGVNASDQTDNAFGGQYEYTVGCSETPSVEYEMADDSVETALTATFYNADGAAAAETFSADESQTVSIKVKAGANDYFGNPYAPTDRPNVLCLQLNSTTWDKPDQVYTADGDLKSVAVPNRLTAVADKNDYCYELPVLNDKITEVFLELNTDDSTAPGVDDTAHIFAGSYYLNADTSEIEFGVEDEDDNAVGTDAADTVTLDFTA